MNLEAMSSSSVLYSVEYTAISALEFGQNNIENQLIKPRKNSPFRTHPLRARIILALIGCCSDHGSRRGQLGRTPGAASCSTNSPRIFLAIVVSCSVFFFLTHSLTHTFTVIPILLVQSLIILLILSLHIHHGQGSCFFRSR